MMAMGRHLATRAEIENCWVQASTTTNLVDVMNLMNVFFLSCITLKILFADMRLS